MTWFDKVRLGLFIHWGHSSQQGIELSWPLTGGMAALPEGQSISVEQYHSSSATFDPRSFDAQAIARLAKRAGMQYAVLTAKHHDGYAMFDTKASDFSVVHSPYGRDIVREYVDAMRDEGLRVGLYFSLIDWHHPDYPPFTQADQPYQWGRWPKPDPERWPRFIEFMFAQVRELLTNYGRIDVIWFDGGWERSIDDWRSKELEAMIRLLQPEILINDRLPGCGDYATPEQFVPPKPAEGPWETCMTMNESWGYNPSDTKYKSERQLIHTLCEVAGRGGNLLLNVSPMGDGRLPVEQVERIEAIASWIGRNGESIVGTEPGLEPWQFYGPSTSIGVGGTSPNPPQARRDNTTYLHLLMRPYDSVTVRGVRVKRVERVRVLGSGNDLSFSWRCTIPDRLLNPDPLGELTIDVPKSALDEHATVLAVEFRDGG